jgi:hypothetical protein
VQSWETGAKIVSACRVRRKFYRGWQSAVRLRSLRLAIKVHLHGKNWSVDVKTLVIAFALAFSCLLAQDASAAVKFKRFVRCGEGPVTVKTCECHAANSRIWHFCHAGEYCHTFDGTCHK